MRLAIDGLASGGSALALEERGDPPVAIGGPLVDEVADVGNQIEAGTALRTALRPRAISPFDDVGSGDLQCGGDGLHGESPGLGERDSKVCFFARARSRASLRISTSMVLRPRRRSSSRTRSSSLRASEAGTTSSSARMASLPPSLISRLHRNTRLGESPWRRAT